MIATPGGSGVELGLGLGFGIEWFDTLWRSALILVPVALATAALLRVLPARPSTRHAAWTAVLLAMLVVPVLAHARPAALWHQVITFASDVVAPDVRAVPPERRAEVPGTTGSVADAPPSTVMDDATEPRTAERLADAAIDAALAQAAPTDAIARTRTDRDATADADRIGRLMRALDTPAPVRDRPVLFESTPSTALLPTNTIPTDVIERASRDRTDSLAASESAPLRSRSVRERNSSADRTPFRQPAGPSRSAGLASAPSRSDAGTAPIPKSGSATSTATAGFDPTLLNDAARVAVPALVEVAGASARSQVSRWTDGLERVRAALVALPTPPIAAWLVGSLIAIAIAIGRTRRFMHILRGTVDAEPETRALVATVCRQYGIGRVPTVRMSERRLSPLLWCPFRRATLVLPRALWLELDPIGRQAVVAHEIAHLRRRDHLVAWLSLAAGVIYWWNPLVWWLRRRVEEEADLSCDAWVTTLLPDARRAYATALLRTTAYAGGTPTATGALALTSNRTRRFARRLTMVMSRTTKPAPTVGGALIACTLALATMAVAPSIACPPDEKDDAQRDARVRGIATAPSTGVSTDSEVAELPRRLTPPPPAPVAPARVRGFAAPAAPAAPLPPTATVPAFPGELNRLDRLEQRLDRLEALLERLLERPAVIDGRTLAEPAGFDRSNATRAVNVSPTLPIEATECVPSCGSASECESGSDESCATACETSCSDGATRAAAIIAHPVASLGTTSPISWGAIQQPGGSNIFVRGGDEEIVRRYELASGKLDAITELMSLETVPTFINPGDGEIHVLGDSGVQNAFDAFARLIDTDDEDEVLYRLDESQRDAMWELMARDDVPIFVRPHDEGIILIGTPLEQMVFANFVKLLTPREGAVTPATRERAIDMFARAKVEQAYEGQAIDTRMRDVRRDALAALEARVAAMAEHRRHLDSAANALESQLAELNELHEITENEREADALAEVAERLEREIERLEEQRDALEEERDRLMEELRRLAKDAERGKTSGR